MKHPVKNIDLDKRVFAASEHNFTELALELFQFQYGNNEVYRKYCDLLKIAPETITTLRQIPFLPISFFKSHQITTTAFEPEVVFESSGTTGTVNSRHYIKDVQLYKKSFSAGFEKFYGAPENKCILGLLPSYLERNNSSLVFMVDELIKKSNSSLSGFYLYDLEKLHRTLLHNEILKQPTLLIGVTYALLDFAEQYPMQLRNTIVMETGGMKGRREEATRQEVHQLLQKNSGTSLVHSEYGMTELLSQAYSKGDGIFHCPAWMKVVIREEDDPFAIHLSSDIKEKPVSGALNIIDLANVYSCCFIATSDVGRLYSNGSFEVLGRMDNSDIRGCSLMAL
ncbi:acyl transferase [Ferruginibacter sp. SUN106]|uniref:LuxE/PaaK family acyltransferase n=1 Tax=Ferruginibacter sp. SUN106 TaxID=2978348 RepID=UPI003D36A614